MNRQALLGNRHITEPFLSAVRSGKLACAYLIEGVAGSGKRTLADLLIHALVCTGDEAPCYACRDCQNVTDGTHPDVHVLECEKDRNQISVDVARRANAAAMTAPIHAARHVFLIPEAQKMGEGAQNALLKNLEEPRSHSIYLLLCEEAGALLATVRSRCVIYRMQLLDEQTIRDELIRRNPKASPEDCALYARLSGGALGQAEAYLTSRRAVFYREKVDAYLRLIAARAPYREFIRLAPVSDKKREELGLFYRMLLAGARDALVGAHVEGRLFFDDAQMPDFSGRERTLMALCEKLCELSDPAMSSANMQSSLFALAAIAST